MRFTIFVFRTLPIIWTIFDMIGVCLVIIKPGDCFSPILNVHISYYLLALSLTQLVTLAVIMAAYVQMKNKIDTSIELDKNFNAFLFVLNFIYGNIYYNFCFLLLCTFNLAWFINGVIIACDINLNCFLDSVLVIYTIISFFANIFLLIIEIPSFKFLVCPNVISENV